MIWCIPPRGSAPFAAQMEQVLQTYRRAYDPARPVVCMDEQPRQLVGNVLDPLPMGRRRPEREDHEYVRKGTCTVWMFAEPLAGWRWVAATERRTCVDWALNLRAVLASPRYALAERITLVCDNLSTHSLSSLYRAFPPDEALQLADRIEIVHTPVHGSWLNVAEIELSAMSRQCLSGRSPDLQEVDRAVKAWAEARNSAGTRVDRQFTTEDARIKLKHLYPQLNP